MKKTGLRARQTDRQRGRELIITGLPVFSKTLFYLGLPVAEREEETRRKEGGEGEEGRSPSCGPQSSASQKRRETRQAILFQSNTVKVFLDRLYVYVIIVLMPGCVLCFSPHCSERTQAAPTLTGRVYMIGKGKKETKDTLV